MTTFLFLRPHLIAGTVLDVGATSSTTIANETWSWSQRVVRCRVVWGDPPPTSFPWGQLEPANADLVAQ